MKWLSETGQPQLTVGLALLSSNTHSAFQVQESQVRLDRGRTGQSKRVTSHLLKKRLTRFTSLTRAWLGLSTRVGTLFCSRSPSSRWSKTMHNDAFVLFYISARKQKYIMKQERVGKENFDAVVASFLPMLPGSRDPLLLVFNESKGVLGAWLALGLLWLVPKIQTRPEHTFATPSCYFC